MSPSEVDLVADEETDLADSDDDDDNLSTASVNSSNGSSLSNKKKKKKKKKKASLSDGTETLTPAVSSKPKADGKEAEKRFQAAIDGVKQGELWVDLSNGPLQISKTKRLLDSLKSNDSVTSLNLTNCSLNDEAAQTIAAAFALNGGAIALIDLDLRDNPLTEAGLNALDGLKKIRKKLLVRTGPTVIDLPEYSALPQGRLSMALAGGGRDARGGHAAGGGTPNVKGSMFRKFFQSSSDDDDDSNLESQLDDRGVDPDEMWKQINGLIHANPPGIPDLGVMFQQLNVLLLRETQAINSPNANALDGSKPHIRACLSHANQGLLNTCLSAVPRRVSVQYSSEPQAAVGSHRVAVAELIAILLSPSNISINKALAATKLVPAILHLAFSHALCSSLHVRALQVLCSCLECHQVPELCLPILTLPGWGCGLTETPAMLRGLGIDCSTASASGVDCRPLPELLAASGSAALGISFGSRSRAIGFVIASCRALLEAAEGALCGGGKRHEAVKVLEASSIWGEFAERASAAFSSNDGGPSPLRRLIAEQDDQFCGPKPIRPPVEEMPEMSGGLAAAMSGGLSGLGGGMMSGRDILALLQGMSLGGGSLS